MDLQETLERVCRQLGVVGAQAATWHDERFEQAAVGLADVREGTALTPNTPVQVGSTGKLHTAVLVLGLVDEGVLDLDAPLATLLPDLALPGGAERAITCRHLLSMSSGLDLGPYVHLGYDDDALGRYPAVLADLPLLFEPGAGFSYSNAGSTLAGLVAERIAGRPWRLVLADRLLGPAGLHRTTVVADLMAAGTAVGHRLADDGTPVAAPARGFGAAHGPAGATLCATAGDLVRLARLLLDDGVAVDGGPVLSPRAVKAMHTPQVACGTSVLAEHWGLGPTIRTWGGLRVHGHTGTNVGGSSTVVWLPERGVAVAVTTNVPTAGSALAGVILDAVLPALAGVTSPPPPFPPAAAAGGEPVDADRLVGTYRSAVGEVVVAACADDGLVMRFALTGGAEPVAPVASALHPLGGDRFWPADPALSGGRGWDVAFVGTDGGGRAARLQNGLFAMPRVADPTPATTSAPQGSRT